MSWAIFNLECTASAVFTMDPGSWSRLCQVFHPTISLHEGPSHRSWCAIKTRGSAARFSIPGSLDNVFCCRQSEGQGIANIPLGAVQSRMLSTEFSKDRESKNPTIFPLPELLHPALSLELIKEGLEKGVVVLCSFLKKAQVFG